MTPTQGVPVELADGETYSLRYTNRALVALEEETGMTIAQAGHRMEIGSLRAVSAMVWAGLLHKHPKMTRAEVVDLVDLTRLKEIADAAARALNIALGQTEEEEEDEEDSGNE